MLAGQVREITRVGFTCRSGSRAPVVKEVWSKVGAQESELDFKESGSGRKSPKA